MKIKKIKLNKIKIFLSKLPRALGERAFLTFFGILIIFLIFSTFLFYKYIFLVERLEPEISEKSSQFDESLFQKVSQEFEERQKRFEEIKIKKYPDPFVGGIIIEESPGGED